MIRIFRTKSASNERLGYVEEEKILIFDKSEKEKVVCKLTGELLLLGYGYLWNTFIYHIENIPFWFQNSTAAMCTPIDWILRMGMLHGLIINNPLILTHILFMVIWWGFGWITSTAESKGSDKMTMSVKNTKLSSLLIFFRIFEAIHTIKLKQFIFSPSTLINWHSLNHKFSPLE